MTMDNAKKAAPAKESAPLIRAKVRPGCSYGGQPAGTLVDVSAKELHICAHILIAVDEEARLREEASKPTEPTPAQLQFRALRESMVAGARASEEAKRENMRKHLETLGLSVK